MSDGDLILFRSQDGKTEVQLRVDGETVWLSQAEVAQLFDNKPQAITMLIRAIYKDRELDSTATCKESLQVRQEGSRQVTRSIKLFYAVVGQTAAELIVERADPDQPNMSLTNWSGSRVRKQDVIVAKNYLNEEEIDTLNRLVVIFLEQAELRVKQRRQLSLDYWRSNMDRLLEFNEQPVLQGAGSIQQQGHEGHR